MAFLRADASDYVLIGIENRGILIIPSKDIKDYWYNLKVLPNGHIKIRIKEDNGKIVLYNNKDQVPVDITEYLHRL